MRRSTISTLIGLSALLAASTVIAGDLYQWKDANGVTHYSQTPPAKGTYTEHAESGRSRGGSEPVQVATASSESPQCATARTNIAMLESKDMVQMDSDGDGKPDKTLSDSERSNQLELARASLKVNCNAGSATPGT